MRSLERAIEFHQQKKWEDIANSMKRFGSKKQWSADRVRQKWLDLVEESL